MRKICYSHTTPDFLLKTIWLKKVISIFFNKKSSCPLEHLRSVFARRKQVLIYSKVGIHIQTMWFQMSSFCSSPCLLPFGCGNAKNPIQIAIYLDTYLLTLNKLLCFIFITAHLEWRRINFYKKKWEYYLCFAHEFFPCGFSKCCSFA